MATVTRSVAAAVVFAACASLAPPADAYNEFQKVFVAEYAKGKGVDRDFARLVRKAKCYVCHQGKDDRKNCNRYGLAVGEHLGEDDKKDKEKIVTMLRRVADEPAEQDGQATFGELIARGELPGGSLEECKKEPPTDPEAVAETSQPDTPKPEAPDAEG